MRSRTLNSVSWLVFHWIWYLQSMCLIYSVGTIGKSVRYMIGIEMCGGRRTCTISVLLWEMQSRKGGTKMRARRV